MKCEVTGCNRTNLSQKELDIHMKYFHGIVAITHEQPQKIAQGVCPECGSTMWFQEGCATCHTCGYSKCG